MKKTYLLIFLGALIAFSFFIFLPPGHSSQRKSQLCLVKEAQSQTERMNTGIHAQAQMLLEERQSKTDSLFGDRSFFWKKKTVLVYFLDDDGNMRDKVLQLANGWRAYSGVTFVRGFDKSASDIRVSFRTDGWWSYLGSDAEKLGKDSVSLSLDSLYLYDQAKQKSVVLHEFGHALGLVHEHQSPNLEIKWDYPALFQYYHDTYGVDSNWVKINVVDKYRSETGIVCEADSRSIMIYEIPPGITTNGYHVEQPLDLSALDKKLVRLMYTKGSCE